MTLNATENGPLSSCFLTYLDVDTIRLDRQREQEEHRKRAETEDTARRERGRHKREEAQYPELREAIEGDALPQLQANQYRPQAERVPSHSGPADLPGPIAGASLSPIRVVGNPAEDLPTTGNVVIVPPPGLLRKPP